MDGKRKILIFLFFLFASVAYGQSISYTYVDPCTGIPNTVTVSSQSGTVVMFYAGNYQTFTMAQLQAGGYEAWVAQVNAAAPPGSNPCAGNAGAVSGSTSASVGTNVTATVTTVTGALSTLGGSVTTNSGGLDVGGSTTSGGSSSSGGSNSNDSGNDQGNDQGGSSSDDSGSDDGGNSSGSSGSTNGGSSSGGSTSGSTDSGSGGGTGGSSGSGGGTTGGSSGGGSGGSGGSGGGSGGSSGGGTSSSNTEGGNGVDGTGSATSGGGDDSSSGGAMGDKSIESSSGGQSDNDSDSDSGGGGGGKKKKGPRARKGSLIASGDMVVIRNGSDYKQGGNDNLKINMGMTYANTDQTLAAGALLNYTTGQNEVSFTGYGSWKIEESMIVGSNSILYNPEQSTWFNTGNVMYAYKQTSYMTVLYGTNFSIGKLGEENFNNWSAQVGVFTTFNGYKGVAVNLMGIGMYSPYTFFYEGQWFKGGFLLVPLTSVDLSITNTFKLNISTSTVLLQGSGILNFQLMTGGKMLL